MPKIVENGELHEVRVDGVPQNVRMLERRL